MADESDVVTVDEAIAMLPDGEYVHTFRNPNGMLVGADWKRAEIEDALRAAAVIHRTGELAQRMGHGLAINDGDMLFIATRKEAHRG